MKRLRYEYLFEEQVEGYAKLAHETPEVLYFVVHEFGREPYFVKIPNTEKGLKSLEDDYKPVDGIDWDLYPAFQPLDLVDKMSNQMAKQIANQIDKDIIEQVIKSAKLKEEELFFGKSGDELKVKPMQSTGSILKWSNFGS